MVQNRYICAKEYYLQMKGYFHVLIKTAKQKILRQL